MNISVLEGNFFLISNNACEKLYSSVPTYNIGSIIYTSWVDICIIYNIYVIL